MEAPVFPRPGFQTTRAAPGSEACIVLPVPTGTPPFTYEWSRAGATLDDRFRTSVDAGGVRLTVSSAQIGDSGVYTLQASNAAGKDTTRVSLEVSADETPTGDDPPTFLRRLQDLTVKVGTRTRFLVEILSSTECKVTWYRNERRLLEAERIALVRDGNFWCADIAAVSVDDAGRWTCTAENLGGRASCSAHLNVLVPKAYKRPEFVEELRAILTEHGTVSLECKVVGVPTPVLRWFKDSREIKAGDVFALTANADDPTSLGTYTCEAINCMGRAYSSSKVHVVGRSKEGSDKPSFGGMTPDPPPIFTKELEDQFVRICDHLSLGCQIVVPPWPRSVIWYNKEGKIDPSTKYHIIEDGVGGYMIEVSASEWADEGEWKCVATSVGGRVGISTCSVTMDVPKNYRKPRFMENLQAVLTEEGLVSFECKVVGFPTPVLSWFKDGQELKPGDVYQLTGTNSLGSYCCIARNCMGQASSSAELTVEDIQNQLNEEEKLQLFSKNQAPKFLQGLKSVEVKIEEPFRFTIKVVVPPEPTVLWYRDDQPIDESPRCHLGQEERGVFYLDIKNLELIDQTEWKCVAMNDYGHSVTSCFLKLIIPRHYKKPRFLENLQAILSDEGAVNLECKVIGVPQPVLKWYKDGEELKPGDIHRIISGQDGTCCLGTYTCEAQNCMGIAASSASLLGFEDTVKAKKKRADDQILQRNLSLSTIHEERTSQMYDTPIADVTLDEKGEISFSFDGKEVSVSLYETPDLTEEEALQIVEMYADQLSENVTEHNVIELPPLRFVKETSTSGNLLMEAVIIDVSPDYFVSPEEDLRTEADIEDISIAEENGQAQLSFDQEVGDEYIEKTMALLSEEKADIPSKPVRRKSDSQKSGEDFFSLSREQSLSEEKRDDDTQMLSESVSFASAHSIEKQKSKPSQEDEIGTQESSDVTKTVLLREDIRTSLDIENKDSKRISSTKRDSLKSTTSFKLNEADITNLNENIVLINSSISKILNRIQILERDIILKSQLSSTAAIATKSLEIINSIVNPLTEIHSITDAFKETISDFSHAEPILFDNLPQSLKNLQNSLAMVEKCIDVGSDKTLINNTCINIVNNCAEDIIKFVAKLKEIPEAYPSLLEAVVSSEIELVTGDILNLIDVSKSTVSTKYNYNQDIKNEELSIDKRHLNNTQKAIYNLKVPVNSLLDIIENALNKSPLSPDEINNAEVILFNMSSSIQDLQTALEHIEFLSVEETNSSLEKYNTTTIETVIGSVLKLRNSFESLSFEKERKYDNEQLQSVLHVIKVDLQEIASHIDNIEKKIGQFDVLYGDNKLEILQKMAHILISLENNLPLLNSLPNVQKIVTTFHKHLTKALEIVIESNESVKYCTFLRICDVVSRINVSIKGLESRKYLSLTSIGNNLSIIEDILKHHSIDEDVSEEILKSINQYYVDIPNVIAVYADENSVKLDSEPVEDISIDKFYTESKANVVVQQIDQVIAVINNISPDEIAPNLCHILPVLQNTCPVLEELKYHIASLDENIQGNSHVSDISQSSIEQSFGKPLQAMQENIIVLNQVLLETIGEVNSKDDARIAFAKPLYELYTTLQTLQENIISQYESFSLTEHSEKIAKSVEVLQNCILIVEEQCDIEVVDEMSTSQDISCIKTTADAISDNLISPMSEEIMVQAPIVNHLEIQPKIAHEFQLLHNDILEIQKVDILEALNSLSEVKEYANIKSVTETIEEIQHKIVSILSPLVMESLSSVSNLDLASTNLTDISESLLKLKNHLTVIDVDNIPIYEDVLKIPSSKIHSIVKNIANIKEHLDKCILLVQQSTYAIDSKEMQDLRNICDNFKFLMRTVQTDILHDQTILNLVNAVENFLRVIEINPDLKSLDVISVSKDLYQHVMIVEDTILQFIAPTNFTPQPLEETIHKLACSLAVLEHCNFELFGELNEHYPEYISEIFKETEYLNDMENVIQNKIITIQDTSCQTLKTESQKTELLLLQNFFENCKNSFSIIGIILKQRPSQKKIIRLIQEFFALQVIINNFKDKQSMLICNPEFLTCLDIFLNQAEGNIVKIKTSIIKISKSLSNTLFKEPLNKINDCLESFPNYLKLDSMLELHDLIQNFLISISIAAPHLENLEQNVIKELEESMFINTNVENKLIIDSLENFLSFLEREMCDNPSKQKELLLKEMIKCFKNHQDYKNAVGTGKRMIILKCLADCSDILRKTFINVYPETKIVERRQPDSLENALTELKELLEALNLEINKIQENSGVIRSTPIDQVLDLSLKNIMSSKESCEKLVEGNGETSVCENNISLINDVIQEIHIIQDTMNTLQCDSSIMFKNLKEIENFVSKILPNNEVTDNRKFSKGKPRSLLQHVEQYIEVTEIIEEISAIVNLGTVKETKEIAQELRESLAADDTLTLNASEEFKYCTVSENQENLAQLLQKSLSNIQESDLTACENTVREHVLEVISQLQDDLKTIASSDVSDQHSVNIDLLDNNALSMKKDNTTLEVTQAELCQNNDVESSNSGTPVKNQPDNAELLIHQIEDTISCICNMTVEEIPSEIKNIYPVLENICPILEELKLNIASIQENFERTESPVSDISEILVEKAFSKPFQELEENISILNQIILETFKDIAVNEQVGVLAKSLHELHVTYQILQQNVMSQYESFSSLNTNVNFAATEQILHNCVLLVQQPYEVEVADEISTLEDISGIKTTANSISSDIAIAQETQVTTQENIEDNKLQFDLIKLSDSIEVQETEAVSEENVSSSMELPLYPNPEITRETTDSIGGHIQNKINDSPEVLRQCVEPAQEVTPTDQVAIEKSGQRTGDQVSGLTEQLNTTVKTITEEITPVSEHVETSEIKISPTRELLLKPECEYTEDTTLNEDIKTNGTDSSKILNESVDPVENALLKIQSPTENCIEQKEENIAELSELPIISEQANAQETQSTLKEYIAANEIKTFSACEQETMITIDKDIETKLEESSEINDTYFDPEEDTAPKLHIPTEKCIERNEENISQLIQQPNICEKAIVEEVQSNLEEHFETSETKTSSLEQSLEPENAIVREITTPIDEDIKNNLDNSYERSEENIVDVIEQSITDQANAQENQGTLKDSTEISENKNISSYEEPFKLDKTMETSSVGDAQKINLPTEKCIEKREENISYLIEQANLSEKAIVKETQSNLEEYIETTETTLFSSHEQLFKPESEIEQDKAISIDEDIEKKVEISPELIARSESEEDASVIVQVSTEKTIERSVEDVFQHTEQPMAPIKESIAQETKDTPKELNETNEVNISKPNQEIKDPMMAQDSSETNSLLEKISSATKRNEIQPTREIPNMPMDNSNIILCETNLELEINNIIQGMDSLINELHDKLNSATVINIDTADSLQNILDELQVQIIKLKSVNIKDASDTLNETVEDLECSVRSVQLLVTENSPADHITEASATIKLLVNAIKEDLSIMPLQDATKTKTDILEDCVGDTETTLLLLDKASQSTIDSDDILKILSNLNCVKDSINRIKLSFSVNEETVIEQGIEIMQSLDVIEQQLFSIESDLAQISKINSHTRDTIVTAVHSVYTNISNIRGTISSIQKRYIYQNYAKPSENLLKAIKNINFIKNIDSKKDWMLVAKHFRNILNHFEEIKFYINLDKTARQPCDTSLTKVVLNELRLLLSSVVLTNIKELKLPLDNSVDLTIKYVEDCLQNIDHTPTIEVREKIPIFKGLTAKLLELTSDMLHEYEKHKNDCSLNLNESQNEQISTSFPQYTLEEQTTLEIPKTSHDGETNLNSISAPKISSITNESPPFENCAHFTEDNVEKKMWVKESVQPIIEHLIAEATNVILLRKLKDENIEGLEEKDDYENSFLHATSDQFGHEFLDEIERKIQTNSSIIEGPVETVENQNVVEVNDLKLGSGNMLRDEEEILILDETLQLTETVTEDICNNKVTQSHEDEIDINKSSIYKLEKMLQNSNDENNICQIDYDESLINQNKVLDFKDEAKTKENQEIKPLSAFKPPEEQEEKLINNNKVELGNQESDNRKEDSFVLKKGENEQKRDSLTVNDPVTSSKYDNQLTEQEETQTHDEILIEEQVPLNVDIQEKSQIKDTLNSKIGKTLNQESKQETEIDDVQFGMKIEEKESILFEANREHTTVRNEVDEKCNFIDNKLSDMESNDYHNKNETRIEQEFNTSDTVIRNVVDMKEVTKEKIEFTEKEAQFLYDEKPDNKISFTEQCHNFIPEDHDRKQHETENSFSVNETSESLQHELDVSLEKLDKGIQKTISESIIEGKTEDPVDQPPQKIKVETPVILNHQQPVSIEYLNLNKSKGEMTISSVQVEILTAIVSEQEKQTNLDELSVPNIEDNLVTANEHKETPIESQEKVPETENSTSILENRYEIIEGINKISQSDKADLLSEEQKFNPSLLDQDPCLEIHNKKGAEPENHQQNMEYETKDTVQPINIEPIDTFTAQKGLESSSIGPPTTMENKISENEQSRQEQVRSHETMTVKDVITEFGASLSQPESKDLIISNDENNRSTLTLEQKKFIPMEVDNQNINDTEPSTLREINENNHRETDRPLLEKQDDGETRQNDPLASIKSLHIELISEQNLDRESIDLSTQNYDSVSDKQYKSSQEENKKISESKLETNGLSKRLKSKSLKSKPDAVEDDNKKNNGKYRSEDTEITRQKRQEQTDVQKTDNIIDEQNTETSDHLSMQILDSNVYDTFNKTQSNNMHTELDKSLWSKDINTAPNDVKEKPHFNDTNLVDSSMEFLRPPGYIPKSFPADNLLSPETDTYVSTSNKFYKAQSLVRDNLPKTKYTPDHDRCLSKDKQLGLKATSESRSINYDKRTSSARDLKRKPAFTTHLTNRTAVEGSRVKLTCSVLSSTEPVMNWYKNGILLDDKHKYKIKFNDGLITMELLNALPGDSGDYSCTVENEHGSITTSAKLKVYPSFEASPIPPTFTRSIRDIYHRAENELVLECRIRGQPLPIISWFKNNQLIVTDERYQASYLADGLCRLTINKPTKEDSGTYTCKAESAAWSDQITHYVNFDDPGSRLDSHISSVERLRLSHDTRRPHFTNVLSDDKVPKGGTIGLQVEIGGAPTRVEWLREGSSVTELDKNAQTFVDHGTYMLALSDVSELHSGLYTCRAWSKQGSVDMNAEISVVQPNEVDGKPPVIVSRPPKDVHISVGEDVNISFRVQGEPKPKVFIMKGIRDITNSQRVCKMTSDDYVKFTLKRSVISDAGTYCILARNVYGCDRAFVTVAVRQRASSDNLISDWTYPADGSSIVATDRKYKSVPGRIPGEPSAVDGGNNWITLAWPKSDPQEAAPILAYRVDSWLLGKEGGARWVEMGITPRTTFDAFNLKQGEEYHFRVTPRNRYGWGEPVQTSTPIGVGIAGDRPEFIDILPGLLKVLVGETANLSCSFKGKPTPDIVWMKNGREIEESSKFRSRQSGNVCSLTIRNVETEDEGRYSCEATNAHGRSSTYARMTVITDRHVWEADAKLKRERSADATGEYPPQFTMRLRDRRVQATYPVRLTCQVIGSPKPNVTWFKDGQEIIFDTRKTQYQDEHFHTLEIAPTMLDDGGLYEALARNNSGAVSCRCNLVVDKGIRAYVAPEFCCGLEPLYRLNEGDELRVSAIVEAYPSVGVTWYRDGVRLRPSRRAIMTLDRDGQIELALASVTPRDAGVYTCTASNEVGQASTSGKVEIVTDQREERRNLPTVICPDVPYSKEPMFIKKPRSTEAQEGDTVIIECEVIGDPTPEVYWLRDFLKPDYYRDAKHFKQLAAGPLYRFEIPHAKLDYTGAYSVVARNIHGEAKAIISLQIFAKDLRSNDETHNIRYGRVEVIPRFEKELTDLLCYDGDAIEFECHVSGNPEPDIRWFHYNQILPDCPDFESTYDLGTARLKIKQVAAEDEGTYTCEASNNLGKATSTACLVVYPPGEPNTLSQRLQRPPTLASAASTPRSTPRVTPARSMSRTPARSGPDSRRSRSPTREVGPKFYTYPYNKVVEEGDSVILQCAVGGFPTPWASWDKDGIIITPTSRISIKEKDDMLRILQIDEVNVDDVGLYRITLENDFGRAEASARLEVISHKGKFHSRSSSVSPARLHRRRTPSFTRQD